MKEAHVDENVSVGGADYSVRDGVVFYNGEELSGGTFDALRLAYEKTVARRSPLLALAGTDPQELADAVDALRQTAQLLAQKQSSPRDAVLVGFSLYPVDFLSKAAQLEQARLTFLSSGSMLDAFNYERAQRIATSAYLKDISRFRSAFTSVVPQGVGTYVTMKHIVDRAGTLSALTILQNGMESTSMRFEERNACFRGMISRCDIRDIQLPMLDVPAQQPPSDTELAQAHAVRDMLSDPIGYTLIHDTPLAQLSDSACISPQPGTALLFTYEQQASSGASSSLSPLYIGDISFIHTNDYAASPFYSYFLDHGMSYAPVNLLSYYNCPLSGRDIGTLLAIEHVRAFASTHELSDYAAATTQDILVQFENVERTAPVISEQAAVEYIMAAETLVQSGSLPGDLSTAIISLALELQDRSDAVLENIFAINASERENIHLSENGVPYSFSSVYLFFARSSFPTLFMDGNLSAIPAHSDFFKPNSSVADLPYSYYSAISHQDAATAELVTDLTHYHALHAPVK